MASLFLHWCEAVAWSHSECLGITLQHYQDGNRAMAIRHAHYDYIAASVTGDRLLLGTWIANSDHKIKMERHFQIIKQQTGRTIFRGQWQLACIEISSGRPKRMPALFAQVYGEVAISIA